MGQRHQIYIIIKGKVYGFHHQWLYGITALQTLYLFCILYRMELTKEDTLKDLDVSDDVDPKIVEKLKNIFKIITNNFKIKSNKELGYLCGAINRNYPMDHIKEYLKKVEEAEKNNSNFFSEYEYIEELTHPFEGDNNDGITIIDLTNYDSPICGFHYFTKNILTPEEYLKKYYEDFSVVDTGSLNILNGNTCSKIINKFKDIGINIMSNERCIELFGDLDRSKDNEA